MPESEDQCWKPCTPIKEESPENTQQQQKQQQQSSSTVVKQNVYKTTSFVPASHPTLPKVKTTPLETRSRKDLHLSLPTTDLKTSVSRRGSSAPQNLANARWKQVSNKLLRSKSQKTPQSMLSESVFSRNKLVKGISLASNNDLAQPRKRTLYDIVRNAVEQASIQTGTVGEDEYKHKKLVSKWRRSQHCHAEKRFGKIKDCSRQRSILNSPTPSCAHSQYLEPPLAQTLTNIASPRRPSTLRKKESLRARASNSVSFANNTFARTSKNEPQISERTKLTSSSGSTFHRNSVRRQQTLSESIMSPSAPGNRRKLSKAPSIAQYGKRIVSHALSGGHFDMNSVVNAMSKPDARKSESETEDEEFVQKKSPVPLKTFPNLRRRLSVGLSHNSGCIAPIVKLTSQEPVPKESQPSKIFQIKSTNVKRVSCEFDGQIF